MVNYFAAMAPQSPKEIKISPQVPQTRLCSGYLPRHSVVFLVGERANSRISHSSGQLRKLENVRLIRPAATQAGWSRSQDCTFLPLFVFKSSTLPLRARRISSTHALESLSKVFVTYPTTMHNLDTHLVATGLVESSSHITTSDNIFVSSSASSLRFYFHSGPPFGSPRVNLCHLHVVLIAMDLERLHRPHVSFK